MPYGSFNWMEDTNATRPQYLGYICPRVVGPSGDVAPRSNIHPSSRLSLPPLVSSLTAAVILKALPIQWHCADSLRTVLPSFTSCTGCGQFHPSHETQAICMPLCAPPRAIRCNFWRARFKRVPCSLLMVTGHHHIRGTGRRSKVPLEVLHMLPRRFQTASARSIASYSYIHVERPRLSPNRTVIRP